MWLALVPIYLAVISPVPVPVFKKFSPNPVNYFNESFYECQELALTLYEKP